MAEEVSDALEAAPGPALAPPPPGKPGETVQFEHPFFKTLQDILFRQSERGEALVILNLDANQISLTFAGIRREFSIAEDSADAAMMILVTKALDYVKGLRLGDPLPREILTREASWEPSARHLQVAYQRLTMQMVTWLSGDEHLITDPDQLLQLAGDPQIKRKVNDAFDEAARKLGIPRERRDEVVGFIGAVSKELAYIEAQRDLVKEVADLETKIEGVRRHNSRQRSILELVTPVARMMRSAVAQLMAPLDQVDAQTGEIMSMLKNVDNQIAFIRDVRDDLHKRLRAWEEPLNAWHLVRPESGRDVAELLRELYRFLAPRFMPVNEWALVTKPPKIVDSAAAKPKKKEKEKPTASMKW